MLEGFPAGLRVLRLCSVFEPPDAALSGPGARFDPIGGMQSHAAQLTRALARRGVRQLVITTRPPGAPRRSREPRVCVHRHGLQVPWGRQLWALPAALTAVRRAGAFDLVHAHVGEDVAVLPAGLAAARRARIPLVVTVHCSVRHTYVPAGARGHWLKLAGGTAERAVLPRADAVIALTPRLAAVLAGGGVEPARVHVIPSGACPAAFASPAADPLPAAGHPRVVFAGRLHRQKDVPALIEAVAKMRTTGASLVVVGDGPERATVEAAVARHGLGARVHVTGFRPHREVPAFLAHADVFAMPSVYEELGSALVEAMYAGLPIVASDTGGIPDAVGPAAVLVPPGDPGALAGALDRLLADAEERARLSALARERAARFDWERLADEVLGAYGTALGAAPAAPRVAAPVPAGEPV